MSDMNSSSKFWQTCPLYNAQYPEALTIPSTAYYVNFVVNTICNILLIITGVILNAATILAYWRSARIQNKSSYFLIMLLSAFDLTTAIVGNLAFVLTLALTLHGNTDCTITIFHGLVTFFTVAMSFATLFALNIERYLSIIHPFFHRTKITKPRLLGLAAVCWLHGCVVTLSCPILGNMVARQITTYAMVLGIVVIVCMYLSMCRTVRRSAINPSQGNGNEVKKLQNLKMAKSCAIVVACTVICFLPYAIVRSLERSVFTFMFLEVWATTLTLLSSSLNSLVFFWRNRTLRIEAKAVLKDFTRRLPLLGDKWMHNSRILYNCRPTKGYTIDSIRSGFNYSLIQDYASGVFLGLRTDLNWSDIGFVVWKHKVGLLQNFYSAIFIGAQCNLKQFSYEENVRHNYDHRDVGFI